MTEPVGLSSRRRWPVTLTARWGEGWAAAAGGSGPARFGLGPPGSQEVASALKLLGQEGRGLQAAWEPRQQWPQEGLELQRFGQEVDSFAATCADHEAFLGPDSLGDSLANVDTLWQKQRHLSRAWRHRRKRSACWRLQWGGHPEAQSSLGRCQALLLRYLLFRAALLELAGARRTGEELQQLQTLLQDSYEVPLGVGRPRGRKESPQGETTLPLVTPDAEGKGEP
ncbi:hypothetical protein MC885_016978 [Smutsia gigantea]|nr:hypothetical protein MC885_016978 [Smutsia gigantea]